MLLQTLCRIGLSLLAFGKFSSGPSSIPVMGYVQFDPLPPARSYAHFGLVMLVLDFLHTDPVILAKGPGRSGPAFPVVGVANPDFLLPASDSVLPALPVFLRSLIRPGFASFVLDFLRLGLFLLLHSFSLLGLLLPVLGVACLDFPSSILDFAHLDSAVSLRSFS